MAEIISAFVNKFNILNISFSQRRIQSLKTTKKYFSKLKTVRST